MDHDETKRLREIADAAARYVRTLRAGLPVLAGLGARSLAFRAATDQSAAALEQLKRLLAEGGYLEEPTDG